MLIASPGYAAEGDGTATPPSDSYISDSNTPEQNVKALDAQVARNAADIRNNKTDIATNTKNITNNQMTIDANTEKIKKNTDDIAANTENIASNKTAIDINTKNITSNKAAIETNTKDIETNRTHIAANTEKITTNTADITGLKDLSNITTAGQKAITKLSAQVHAGERVEVTSTEDAATGRLTYTISVNNNGIISAGNTDLVSGGTMYTELRPGSEGYYISGSNTTAANLLALDSNLYKALTALDMETTSDNKAYVSKLSKYFKVNPEITTDEDGTRHYADDASVNGTNSIAIGPGAKVDTAAAAVALGNGATVNRTATGGLAIGSGAVTGSAETTVAKADHTITVAAAGGVGSVAIGTNAQNAGNTSVVLGNGASVTNDVDTGSSQAVVKSDDIAIGTEASTDASDSSTAIGKNAKVSKSTDAVAIGSAAEADSSNDALVLGKGASAKSAADSIALGTSAAAASADTIAMGSSARAEGVGSVVIGKGAKTTGEGGTAIGSSSMASGRSMAIGQSATANNDDALAIGNGAVANADRSISLGYHAGEGTKEGKGEEQNAGSLIAIGTKAGKDVAGKQNIAIGSGAGNLVKSNFNVAIGSDAGWNINSASDDADQNGNNVSIGRMANYNREMTSIMDSTAIGHLTNAANYAVALGSRAKATGTNSMALGYTAQAADSDSVSLGHNASAAGGNVAIGAGSAAPAVSTLGTVQKDGYLYKATETTDASGISTTTYTLYKSAFTSHSLAANSTYISVGSATSTRRISNVADGVFDSDAATVAQLKSLNELLQATDTKANLTEKYFDEKFKDLHTSIDSVKPHYFSISDSSDNQTDNYENSGATAKKADAMAIGPNANATNRKSLAVGNNVYADGERSIAIGTADNPTTDSTAGTVMKHSTSAEGENSIAVGTSTTAQSDNSIAIGTRAQTYTTDTTEHLTGAKAVAIGYNATTAGDESVALGNQATVKSHYGTAIGSNALAKGEAAVAVGQKSKADGSNAMAVGQENSIIGQSTYGLGSSNTAGGGSITTSGISGSGNLVKAVSDPNVTHPVSGIYLMGNSNKLDQEVAHNQVSDITVTGSDNAIAAGGGGTSSHSNILNRIAVLGSGNRVQGKGSDNGMDSKIQNVTILGYGNTVDANTDTKVDFSNTQILGNNVTATLGNSVYLGNGAAYIGQAKASSDAITSARNAAFAAAEASAEYAAATTDEEKAQIRAQYEARYLYKLNIQAMEENGTTAGTQDYSTDETYGDGTSYAYAGASPTGVVTVGSAGGERRIQNVAAGLVSAHSTDAVNGSQLYALTRQLRFGGDNSSFGTASSDDQNVIARGSDQPLAITGGAGVTTTTKNGVTTISVDSTKLTDKNIGVIADTKDNALNVKLASDLTGLHTAQLGTGGGTDYKETIKLDGTGDKGGSMVLKDTKGALQNTVDATGMTLTSGAKFTSSGISAGTQQIKDVKAGKEDTDAVNMGQLKDLSSKVENASWTIEDDDHKDNAQKVKNGDTVSLKAGKNLLLSQDGKKFTYSLDSTLTDMNSITAVDGKMNTSVLNGEGLKVTDKEHNALTQHATEVRLHDGKKAEDDTTADVVLGNQGLQNGGHTITGVADGMVAANSKEAVNGGQLYALQQKVGSGWKLTGNDPSSTISIGADKTVSFKNGRNSTVTVEGSDSGATVEVDLASHVNISTIRLGGKQGADGAWTGGIYIGSQAGGGASPDTDNYITGLSNRKWDSSNIMNGRAATEDQLQAAISQVTTAASNNDLHVKGGTYDIKTTTDGNGQKHSDVTLGVVDGKGEQKETVIIRDVAKASDLGDTGKLDQDIQNKNGTTSVVDAVNNLNDKLNDKVGDNQYLDVDGTEIQNGDSSTTAIGKLNNRMKDISSKAAAHTTVSRADDNVTLEASTDDSGRTNYKIGLNKETIDLGKVTIKGKEGSITAKSVTADNFTSGSTVVDKDGVKIGDKSALTGDTLKVDEKVYISGNGINANDQKITNVAAGSADTDAVNMKQMKDLAARQDAAIDQNAQNISTLGREVDKLDSRIDRVGAGAAALAALNPGQYDPNDKVDFSAGYGNYRGASAAAVGMYYHPDERTIMSLGVALGGGENMVNAGVTWKLGRRTPVRLQAVPVAGAVSSTPAIPVKTTAPAAAQPAGQPEVRPVAVQPAAIQQTAVRPAMTSLQNASAANAQLMDLLARQTAILEKLSEQKAVLAAAPVVKGDDLFPDVPENHWAYSFVNKLAQAGVLKGTPESGAAANPLLTRNDFAQILYVALKNGVTTNPALNQDGSLNRLASEFKAELKNVKK